MSFTMTKNTTVGEEKWELTETNGQTQEVTAKIKAAGKYFDRDIVVKAKAKSGSVTIPDTTIQDDTAIAGVDSSGVVSFTVTRNATITPTVTAGWVNSGESGVISFNASKEYQLPIQAGKTVTPTTTSQTAVAAGKFTTGAVNVAGDANLIASNIKQGVSIFGVMGTLTAADLLPNITNDAIAAYILAGYDAYSENGTLIHGSMVNWSGENITSSATTNKTITFTEITGSKYQVKMYMGSTGYVEKDSTFITDEVISSSISTGPGGVGTQAGYITGSGTQDQYINIGAGYYSSARNVKIAKTAAGSATVSPTMATHTNTQTKSAALQTISSITGKTENVDYVKVTATSNATPSASKSVTSGYITNNEVAVASGSVDTKISDLYIAMYAGEIE